ncbi:MAG: helix-turn-helix domain-containing protein [Steroidobacteraceae bacterium]
MITLTLQQAADLLGLHRVTLAAKAHAGEIPGARIGRRWIFVTDDLLTYIRAHYPRRALQDGRQETT